MDTGEGPVTQMSNSNEWPHLQKLFGSVQFSHFVVPAGKIGLLTGSEEIAHKKNNIKAQKNNAQLPQKDIIVHLKERKNTKIYFLKHKVLKVKGQIYFYCFYTSQKHN